MCSIILVLLRVVSGFFGACVLVMTAGMLVRAYVTRLAPTPVAVQSMEGLGRQHGAILGELFLLGVCAALAVFLWRLAPRLKARCLLRQPT